MSRLDTMNPSKEAFEDLVCEKLLNLNEICKFYGIKRMDLDSLCFGWYGMQSDVIYNRLRALTLGDYKETLAILAARGNTVALTTLNQFVYDMKQEDEVQKIQIIGDIPNGS